MDTNIDIDMLRHSLSVKYNELARVMNSHQETMVNGHSRVEIEADKAQYLMDELRKDLQKLMCLQNVEQGIGPLQIKLDRVFAHNLKPMALCVRA